jgi:dTDP-4-dehydrorhamnose 3,5-epimerase-like enzyme
MILHRLDRIKHTRDDGWLCELVSMKYHDQPFLNIHSYIVSITPQKTRANHFHKFKEEWLCLAAGKIKIYLEDVRSHEKEITILDSDSQDYFILYIPPNIAHSIENIGNCEASVFVFSKNPEDKEDTFPYRLNDDQ